MRFTVNGAALDCDPAHLVVAGWTGRALQLSGAADLLRPYRRRA